MAVSAFDGAVLMGDATIIARRRHAVMGAQGLAEMLGEDEDWLADVANEMDQEDGLIWVYGPGDEGVMAFTNFGIETLQGLIEIHKANPDLLKRSTDPL
jgi:hypothetical protein